MKGMLTSIITIIFFLALFGALALEMRSQELMIGNKGDALIAYRLSQDFREIGFNVKRIIGVDVNITRNTRGNVTIKIHDKFRNKLFNTWLQKFENNFISNKTIGNRIFDVTFGALPSSNQSIVIEPFGIYYGYWDFAKYNLSIYKPGTNIATNITYYELIIDVLNHNVSVSQSSQKLHTCANVGPLCRPVYINVTGANGVYFNITDNLLTNETSVIHVALDDGATYINITFGNDGSNNNGTLIVIYSDNTVSADLKFRLDLDVTNVPNELVRLVFNQDVTISNKLFEIEKRDKVVLAEG